MKTVSGKDFCRVLEKNGWVAVRQKGSHRRFKPPPGSGLPNVTVPHTSKDLKIGTLKNLMSQTGLDESQL